ncbi:MAG: TauD/TfdA family dioxygenase [Pseudoxanthomonas sp.]
MSRTLEVTPCTARIGAEIAGVDLTAPLSPVQVAGIRQALLEHGVIFFREQPISHEDHMRFGRYFGELIVHPGAPGIEGYPLIVAIHGDADSKYVAGEEWHSDLSCNAEPPMGSILYLHTVPPVGGDTLWADMYSAYEALSARMKAYLDGLTAEHDANHVYHALYKDFDRVYPRNDHPVVITHPESGRKALFFNPQYVTRINGVSELESRMLYDFLSAHCGDARFQVRFRWRPHSLAFWDNRCTHHLAIWDYYPQTRSGFRVTLKGARPTF